MTVGIIPITGIGEVEAGDDVAEVLDEALGRSGLSLLDGDIVVVTSKVISKAEGRTVTLPDDGPRAHAGLVEEEAAEVLRRRGDLVIARTRHGFVCANAGVDRSNAGAARAVLLPVDPDRSARRIRSKLEHRHGVELAVVVSDTFGRAWRVGQTDVAVGVAGIRPITDLRGTVDAHGRVLDVTEIAIVDEVAAAAELVMGKAHGIPAAIVRGVDYLRSPGAATDLVRPPGEDLFL